MSEITAVTVRITPETLRKCIKAYPDLLELPLKSVMEHYLVLNVPVLNKNGTLSKRKPIPAAVYHRSIFIDTFYWKGHPKLREFSPVSLLDLM